MPALWCEWPLMIPVLAALLDYVIGDPWHWPHPVRVMGWVIHRYQRQCFRPHWPPSIQRLLGIGLGLGLPLLSAAIAAGIVWLAEQLSPCLGGGLAAITLASCLAGRSLREAAISVLTPLQQGDILTARQRLSHYVGRDTQTLSPAEIWRAVTETLSENATDGVLAPLFYGLLGLAIAPAAGAAGAIAYKALSTLDSMIGYRRPPYTYLGWFSARAEDVATWVPCRLTVLTIALLSGRPGTVWRLCRRDAPADPSPNAGWSECAYAAALGVQLGGVNTYQGQPREKPRLGDPERAIDATVVRQGLALTRWAVVIWLLLGLLGLSYAYRLHCG